MSGADDMQMIADAAAEAMQRAVAQWVALIGTVAAGETPTREARGMALVAIQDAQKRLRTLADALSFFALQADAVLGEVTGETK